MSGLFARAIGGREGVRLALGVPGRSLLAPLQAGGSMFWTFLGLAALIALSHLRLFKRLDDLELRLRRMENNQEAIFAALGGRASPDAPPVDLKP